MTCACSRRGGPPGGPVDIVARQVITVAPRFVARSELLDSLGVDVVEQDPGIGTRVDADPTGRTNVPGVWVAGSVADLSAQGAPRSVQRRRPTAVRALLAVESTPVIS